MYHTSQAFIMRSPALPADKSQSRSCARRGQPQHGRESVTSESGASCIARATRRPRQRFLVASAVALSMSVSAQAFCDSLPRLAQHLGGMPASTARFVVTDPDHLLRMDVTRRRRRTNLEALEDAYIRSPASAGHLHPEEISGEPEPRRRAASEPTLTLTRKQTIVPERKPRVMRKRETVPRKAKKSNRAVPVAKSIQTEQSGLAAALFHDPTLTTPKASTETKTKPVPKRQGSSRSSTMPGFASRGSSDSLQAHRQGILFAEQRMGRKFTQEEKRYTGDSLYKHSPSVPESMQQFAAELHQVERITSKEEKLLGAKTQEALRLKRLYNNLAERLDREPSDEEWCAAAGKINIQALSQTIQEGMDAKDKLVTSNLRMVQGVVNVYIRNGLGSQYNAGDLMQEGIMALVRAAEKFDPTRGFRFSTYAMYWIRSSIKRSQLFQSRIVTIPPRIHETHKRLQRVEQTMSHSLDRRPTKAELAQEMGLSEIQIDRCVTAMEQRCHSLDQTIYNSRKLTSQTDSTTMYDIVAERSVDGEFRTRQKLLREDLIETMHRVLSPEEVYMLLLRFGMIEDNDPEKIKKPGRNMTIAEISRRVGHKPDKVRRIINKSLNQLKKSIGEEWKHFEQDLP